jgi:hypothetical protein
MHTSRLGIKAGQAHRQAKHTGRPGTQAGSAYRQARRTGRPSTQTGQAHTCSPCQAHTGRSGL